MNKILKNPLILFLSLISLPLSRAAAGSTGAAFLKLDAGARAAGMGSAFTAVADDASALYWNPAGTAGIASRQVFVMHAPLVSGMSQQAASFVQPTRAAVLGAGVSYFSHGSYEARDENRNPSGSFTGSDMALLLSAGKKLGDFSAGLNFKWVRQNLASEQASGFAFDLGGKYQRKGSRLGLGAALQNAGPKMKFIEENYDLPLTLALGASLQAVRSLTLSADWKQRVYSGENEMNVGMEFQVFQSLALRTGYLSRIAGTAGSSPKNGLNADLGGLPGIGAGIGLKIFNYHLDYAMVPYGDLGGAHRVSLLAKF